jgi:ElaB/YqjD/DUF883 family membrane-anchored ribosome-binding protein
MKAENLVSAGEQIRSNVAEIAEKARDLSSKVKDSLDDTYNDLGRSVRRAKAVAEDKIEDVRHRVKARPLAAVTTVAASAFVVGMLAGWLIGRKRDS